MFKRRVDGFRLLARLKHWACLVRREIYAVYLVARDPRVPWYVKALAAFVAGYALSPIDLIPDFIPILGYLDDLVLVPLGILAVVKLVPPTLMAELRTTAWLVVGKPTTRIAPVIIILIWLVLATFTAGAIYRHYLSDSRTSISFSIGSAMPAGSTANSIKIPSPNVAPAVDAGTSRMGISGRQTGKHKCTSVSAPA